MNTETLLLIERSGVLFLVRAEIMDKTKEKKAEQICWKIEPISLYHSIKDINHYGDEVLKVYNGNN